MKKGDKVRFLSEIGGGRVAGFQGKDIVLVEDEDGFEVPMRTSEIVVIGEEDYETRHVVEIKNEKKREDREAAIAYAKKMTKRRIFTAYPHGSEIWAEFINLSEDSVNANVAAARQYWSSKPSMKNMRLNESQSEQMRVF